MIFIKSHLTLTFAISCCLLPQTPDSWSDKSPSQRSSSSHKRSASWGSAEHLREVNHHASTVFVTTRLLGLGLAKLCCIRGRELEKARLPEPAILKTLSNRRPNVIIPQEISLFLPLFSEQSVLMSVLFE